MDEIYFSQIREDSWIEHALVRRHRPRAVVCIGSGGCTAFSILDDDVERVHAVDANRAQCALIELKKAAIVRLDRAEYLSFIGETPSRDRRETYRIIRDALPDDARAYWDPRGARIAAGINKIGVTEQLYAFVGKNLLLNVCGPDAVRELIDCDDVERQRALHREHFSGDRWSLALKILFSATTQTLFYPRFWFAKAEENAFSDYFEERFRAAITERTVWDNHFVSQLFYGRYLLDRPEGAPPYLTEDGFAVAQRNIHKLHVVHAPLQRCLPGLRDIDAFLLSNVFDWGKSADHRLIAEAVLAARSDRSLLLHRNMYAHADLPSPLRERFEPDTAGSRELLLRERSMLYRHLVVGSLH